MKKRHGCLVVFLLTASLCGVIRAQVSPIAQGIEKAVSDALNRFETGKTSEGACALLDVVLLTKPRRLWTDGFEKCLADAKNHFQKRDYSEGVSDVSLALALIRPDGKKPARNQKANVDSIAGLFRERVMTAKVQFKNGLADEGSVTVLEALQILAPQVR